MNVPTPKEVYDGIVDALDTVYDLDTMTPAERERWIRLAQVMAARENQLWGQLTVLEHELSRR